MKLFTGIEITADFTTALAELKLRNKHLSGIKWYKPENYHITTYYIGEFSSLEVGVLVETLALIANSNTNIQLYFKKLGFSPGKNPNMLWAYFKLNNEFKNLCNAIATNTTSNMPARFYPTPHVSIARLKKSHLFYKPNFDIILPNVLTIKQVHLWQSISSSKYKLIQSFTLKNDEKRKS